MTINVLKQNLSISRINAFKNFSEHSNRSARHIFRDSATICALLCQRSFTPDKLYYTSMETVYLTFEQLNSKSLEHACFSAVLLT